MAYGYSNDGTNPMKVNLSGFNTITVDTHENEEYKFDVSDMPGAVGDFNNGLILAPDASVQTAEAFDEAKAWKWCWDVSTATQSNDATAGRVNIGGSIEFSEEGSNSTQYKIKTLNYVDGILSDTYWMPKADVETEDNIDPGKVLIWLLGKLKDLLCDNCE